jgi:antirestriction protein ArdC
MKSPFTNATVRSDRQDVYTRVTQNIIVDLEHGVRPWLKPWSGKPAGERVTLPLRHCGTPYQGINILLLWGEAVAKGYHSNRWMTYRQASELGAQVRKGEHGSLVVYADRITKTEQNAAGEAIEREIPYLKGYTVFNIEQIEGLPESFYERPEVGATKLELIEAAEKFFAAIGATVRHGGNRAFYAPGQDVIQLPVPEAFRDAESYAATKAHAYSSAVGVSWHPSREFVSGRAGSARHERGG